MSKIYLAGPMRHVAELNFPAFHTAANQLRAEGHFVFSPAEKDIERSGGVDVSVGNATGCPVKLKTEHGLTTRIALADDLAWICKEADAIALLPGWEHSEGATSEHATAKAIGLDIIHLPGKPPKREIAIDAAYTNKVGIVADLVRQELLRARKRFGKFRNMHEAWGVIGEEWNELQSAIMNNDPAEAAKEAIQVAAMAVSLVADLCEIEPDHAS